jgi:hypothetical protein
VLAETSRCPVGKTAEPVGAMGHDGGERSLLLTGPAPDFDETRGILLKE